MSRAIAVVTLLLCLVTAGNGVSLAADDAVVGQPVTHIGAEGTDLGTVTVDAVHDPFTELRDGQGPEAGSKAVVVELTFDGSLEGGYEVSASKVYLRDTAGALWERAFPGIADTYPVPELGSTEVGPGSRISGYVGYIIPADVQADEVFFVPDDGILLRVADVVPQAPPAIETPVMLAGKDGALATATVRAVDDPYKGFDKDRAPDDGTRFVMLTLTVENTGDVAFQLEPSGVLLLDTQGRLWGRTSVEPAKKPKIPELDPVDLAPGNRVTGRVGYQVPADAVIDGAWYQGAGHLAELVALGAAGEPGSSPAPISSPGASPGTDPIATAVGCDVMAPWWSEQQPVLTRLLALPWFQDPAPAMDTAATKQLVKDITALRKAQAVLAPPEPLLPIHRRFLGALILYQESARLQLQSQQKDDPEILADSADAFEAAQLVGGDAFDQLTAMGSDACGI